MLPELDGIATTRRLHEREEPSPYIVAMTAWGYASLVPVYVVLAAAVLILLIGFVTGPPRK